MPNVITINIRPTASVYATYRRLSYRPWYAIAEFVDNSTQNYYDNRDDLVKIYEKEAFPGKLQVLIDHDSEENKLTIYDNANGMDIDELSRAVNLDQPPPDPSGRCEFGMGLKTASCWFGQTWTISTSKLGSESKYLVTVHVPDLAQNGVEEIQVEEYEADPEEHYTLLTIKNLYKPMRGRTISRVKEQLGSIYRQDIRSGEIEIKWNGELVSFNDPEFLVENENGIETIWKKEFQFTVPWDFTRSTLNVRGWVGVRVPGSQRDAGFALMRRGRVILGGPGEGYKPGEIFGQGNTFRSQRLVGEVYMDDWPVTQAKDDFDWSGGLEDLFIEELKRVCHDCMEKAESYRERARPITVEEMVNVSQSTRQIFSDDRFGDSIMEVLTQPNTGIVDNQVINEVESTYDTESHNNTEPDNGIDCGTNIEQTTTFTGPIIYNLNLGVENWEFRLHWQAQMVDAHWMSVSYIDDRITDVFLNVGHPFFENYISNRDYLELIQKFVVALALAEKMARQMSHDGMVDAGDFRNFMNRVLRHVAELEGVYNV